MKWYSKLYIGDTMKKDWEAAREALKAGQAPPGVYLLCLPANPQERMDIVPAFVLEQVGETFREWEILGLAKGRKEAFVLAGDLMRDVYDGTGAFDVRVFTEGQMK